MFFTQMSVCQQSVLKVTSFCGTFMCVWLAWHISVEIASKWCFHFIGSAYYHYCYILHIFSQYRFFMQLGV